MIQRIQSVYLLLVAVISVVMMLVPLANCGNTDIKHIVLVINILIGIISIVTILLFNKRKLQIKLSWILIILLIVLLSFIIDLSSPFTYKFTILIASYLPILSIILCFLAKRAIKKDEELVRSADRLR